MSDEIQQSIEQKAVEIALGGMASKSTSVDGVSISETRQDPEKLIAVSQEIAKRRAAKRGILSQIRFLKIKDQP